MTLQSQRRRAALLAIGDELVMGQNLDTNSQWLSEQLAAHGIMPIEHRTVADDRDAIAACLHDLIVHVDLIIMTGGLGPTDDDLTRHALADVVAPGEPLATDPEASAWLEKWFRGRGKSLAQINLVQAQRPVTMRCLPNPNGTAPGLAGEHEGTLLFALPGPPREMEPMFREHVIPALPRSTDGVIRTAIVQEYGLGESDAASRLDELTERSRHPLIGTTASESIVSARIRAVGLPSEVDRRINADIERIEKAWSPYVFGRGEQTLAESALTLLRENNATLATAESCTGGWLGKRLVDIAGSSDVYRGGWVTYSNEMKASCLAVPAGLIDSHGAVSAEVAEAMARGAVERSGSTHALSITGVAGPNGGTAEKPVGLVYIALAQRTTGDTAVRVRRFTFPGCRTTVRDRSVKSALQMLRFALLNVADDTPLLWESGTPSPASLESSEA